MYIKGRNIGAFFVSSGPPSRYTVATAQAASVRYVLGMPFYGQNALHSMINECSAFWL